VTDQVTTVHLVADATSLERALSTSCAGDCVLVATLDEVLELAGHLGADPHSAAAAEARGVRIIDLVTVLDGQHPLAWQVSDLEHDRAALDAALGPVARIVVPGPDDAARPVGDVVRTAYPGAPAWWWRGDELVAAGPVPAPPAPRRAPSTLRRAVRGVRVRLWERRALARVRADLRAGRAASDVRTGRPEPR